MCLDVSVPDIEPYSAHRSGHVIAHFRKGHDVHVHAAPIDAYPLFSDAEGDMRQCRSLHIGRQIIATELYRCPICFEVRSGVVVQDDIKAVPDRLLEPFIRAAASPP